MTISVPAWLRKVEGPRPRVVIDMDQAYPAILDALGFDVASVDQYAVEVASKIARLDAALHFPGVPRSLVGGEDYKDRWSLEVLPPGRMAELRAQHGEDAWRVASREACEHYKRLRGFLPA